MIGGLIGATITVFATTLDDAIWLVPYVGSSSHFSTSARLSHALTFVLTLECLGIASVLIALAVKAGVLQLGGGEEASQEEAEILLGSVGAGFCWILALYFFIKKLLKRRRRQKQKEEEEQRRLVSNGEAGEGGGDSSHYGSAQSEPNHNHEEDEQPLDGSLGTIMSLTTLGALDEISYFPALVVGNIFKPWEICLGTLLAASIILIIVTYFLARCKPLADCLDRIPLYAVIGLFAIILTFGVVDDVLSKE